MQRAEASPVHAHAFARGNRTPLTLRALSLSVSLCVCPQVLRSRSGDLIIAAWLAAPLDVKSSVQHALDCCGLRWFNDSAVWPCPTRTVGPNITTTPDWCYPQLSAGMDKAYSHAGGTGIAFAIIMATAIFLVGCLISGVRQKQAKQRAEQTKIANGRALAEAGNTTGAHLIDLDMSMDSAGRDAASMFDKAPAAEQEEDQEGEELPAEYDEDGNPVEYQ